MTTSPPPPPPFSRFCIRTHANKSSHDSESVAVAASPTTSGHSPPHALSESCVTGVEVSRHRKAWVPVDLTSFEQASVTNMNGGAGEVPLVNGESSAFTRHFAEDSRVYVRGRSAKLSAARTRAEMRRLRRVSDSSTASEIDDGSGVLFREKPSVLLRPIPTTAAGHRLTAATQPTMSTEFRPVVTDLLAQELQIKLSTTSTDNDSDVEEEEDQCYVSSKESAIDRGGNANHMSDSTCFDEMYSVSQAFKFVPSPSTRSLAVAPPKLPPPPPPKPRPDAPLIVPSSTLDTGNSTPVDSSTQTLISVASQLNPMGNVVDATTLVSPTATLLQTEPGSFQPVYAGGTVRLDLDEKSDLSRNSVHTSASNSKEALIMQNRFGNIPGFISDAHSVTPKAAVITDGSVPLSPLVQHPTQRPTQSFRQKFAHSLRSILHKDSHPACRHQQSGYKTSDSQTQQHYPLGSTSLDTGHTYDSFPRLSTLTTYENLCDSSPRSSEKASVRSPRRSRRPWRLHKTKSYSDLRKVTACLSRESYSTPVSYRDEGTQYRCSDFADDHLMDRVRQDANVQTNGTPDQRSTASGVQGCQTSPPPVPPPHRFDRLLHANPLSAAWRNYAAVGYSTMDDFRTLSLARMEIGQALDSLKALMESEAANCLCEISTGHIRRCYTILQNVNDLLFCQAYSRPLLPRSSTLSSMNEPTAEPWNSTLRHFSKEPSATMSFMEIERLLLRLRRCLVDTAFNNAMRDFEYLSRR